MKQLVSIIILSFVVSGCSATVLSKNEKMITLESANKLSQKDIYAQAEKHCSSYGKNAVLTVKDRGLHTFECK